MLSVAAVQDSETLVGVADDAVSVDPAGQVGALPSAHTPVVTGVCETEPVAGSQASVVQTFPSSMTTGVPAAHVPVPLQVSAPLHAL